MHRDRFLMSILYLLCQLLPDIYTFYLSHRHSSLLGYLRPHLCNVTSKMLLGISAPLGFVYFVLQIFLGNIHSCRKYFMNNWEPYKVL